MALKQEESIQFKPDNYLYKGDTVSAGVGLKKVLPEQFVAYIEQSENRLRLCSHVCAHVIRHPHTSSAYRN